jgi:hypothetical protein
VTALEELFTRCGSCKGIGVVLGTVGADADGRPVRDFIACDACGGSGCLELW